VRSLRKSSRRICCKIARTSSGAFARSTRCAASWRLPPARARNQAASVFCARCRSPNRRRLGGAPETTSGTGASGRTMVARPRAVRHRAAARTALRRAILSHGKPDVNSLRYFIFAKSSGRLRRVNLPTRQTVLSSTDPLSSTR
jgi:hypothetical protein